MQHQSASTTPASCICCSQRGVCSDQRQLEMRTTHSEHQCLCMFQYLGSKLHCMVEYSGGTKAEQCESQDKIVWNYGQTALVSIDTVPWKCSIRLIRHTCGAVMLQQTECYELHKCVLQQIKSDWCSSLAASAKSTCSALHTFGILVVSTVIVVF